MNEIEKKVADLLECHSAVLLERLKLFSSERSWGYASVPKEIKNIMDVFYIAALSSKYGLY